MVLTTALPPCTELRTTPEDIRDSVLMKPVFMPKHVRKRRSSLAPAKLACSLALSRSRPLSTAVDEPMHGPQPSITRYQLTAVHLRPGGRPSSLRSTKHHNPESTTGLAPTGFRICFDYLPFL